MPKSYKQNECPSINGWLKIYGISIPWNIIQLFVHEPRETYKRVFRRLLLGRRENTGWEEERRKSNVRKKKRGGIHDKTII